MWLWYTCYCITGFCHIIIYHEYIHCCCLVTKSYPTLFQPHRLLTARLLCLWDFLGKDSGWSGLPFPSPGDLPNPGIRPASPVRQSDSVPLSHQRSPKHIHYMHI